MSEISLVNKNLFKDIKSKYMIKTIFSYLDEKNKLEIIKYNKKLQNIENIELTNYRFMSDSYIIYESNKKGKEYDSNYNYLKFEGEYLNKKRNGKGKEYNWRGNLIFEGEYLNGKRNGKGKEYYDNYNILKFEGEYLNGLKWNGRGYNNFNNIAFEIRNGKGYVIEYNDYGMISFEGEYLNGERNGKGKEYNWVGNLKFEGEYLNGKRNGKGIEYYGNNILKFEGKFKNDLKWSGKEYNIYGNIAFEINNGKG